MSKLLAITGAALLVLVACSTAVTDDEKPTSGGTVVVDLLDDSVTLQPGEVESGTVTLEATNSGTVTHEFEIFAGAEPGTELAVESKVADTTDLTLLDEVEDIIPGGSATLTVDLEPGTYLVICNLPGHYAAGTSAFLTVTG